MSLSDWAIGFVIGAVFWAVVAGIVWLAEKEPWRRRGRT